MRRRSLPPLLRCLWSGRSSTWRCAMSLWRQVAHAPDRETAKPLPTLGGVEAGNDNAPSADRILCRVGPARLSPPPRGSVSDGVSRRSGKQRPPRWAARLQARVGSGSASPPPVEPTYPGQRTVSVASLAWRAVCLLADAPMLPGWDGSGRGHWAQLRRDPRPLLHRAGSATPSEGQVRPGRLVLVVAVGHLPAARLPHCPVRWQTHGRKTARPLPHVSWRRAYIGGAKRDDPQRLAPIFHEGRPRSSLAWADAGDG
jgi:hypothetical protein